MPLHLLKLCVGVDSIAELAARIPARIAQSGTGEHLHATRMVPKRAGEIVGDGSLFWVIRGQIGARQEVRAIRPFTDAAGIGRCHLVLDPRLIPVDPRPCRPFQGWRYLADDARPADLGASGIDVAMPENLRYALRELCLI